MGSDVASWRLSIGLFYGKAYGIVSRSYTGKISFSFIYLMQFFQRLKKSFWLLSSTIYNSINNIETAILVWLLIILSGDVETNPGPDSYREHCVSILHCNIRSIRNKLEYIVENFCDFDCLCFTESHLDNSVDNSNILLTNEFSVPYRKDRTNHGGGILVYINNNLLHKRRPDLEIFWEESVWVEIKINKQQYLLGTFYSPKPQDRVFFESLDRNIEKAMEHSQNIVILGDLNEDLLNENYKNLRDIMMINSFQNVITEPTRGRAILDPILVPDDLTTYDSGVIANPSQISDHSATFLLLPHNYSVSVSFTRRVWFYKRANYTQLEEYLRSYDWNCLKAGSVNDSCELFTNQFMEFVNMSIPHKDVTIRPSDKPWYDSEIRRHSRKRDRQKKKAVRTSRQSDWAKYKTLRNKVNNLKRHAKESFDNNLELSLLTNFSNNKKEFWKIVKHFVSKKDSVSTIPPLCTQDAGSPVWHVTDKEKADSLNSYFASVSSLDDSQAELPPFTELTDATLDNIEITEEEINDVIENLDPNKASGSDLISNKMLKKISKVVAKPLCIIFNRSLHEGVFPDKWKLGNLVPLFKKGDKSIPANYRPVSLLSNLGKIQERIVFKHLYNHLHSNNLLYKYQSGFRPGHSTTFQLVDIFHHICQSFDAKQYSCMVFCDISKAFDKVWHRGLLFKLRQKGIKGKLLTWISNYLSDRKQKVQINNATSSLLSVNAGVPQGSVLGPLLFLVYVNDIAENLLSLVRLFADDSSLFFSATNIQDIEGVINHDLAFISSWAKKWLVDFNPIKTVAMLFSLRPVDYLLSLNFNNTVINFVENHKHLGVTFSCNGQWKAHIENILNAAYRTLGIMRKLKYRFSRQALNQMYISYIRPQLEYSSIVWDGCSEQDKTALEKLQNEAARIVTGLTRSTSIANLYKECGWDSLADRRYFQKLCFMYKCSNNLVPDYISDIIPPLVCEVSDYPLRNRNNLANVFTRTETSHRSCVPSSVSCWNSLQSDLREAETFLSFHHNLKDKILAVRKIPSYFMKGPRKLSVIHARIRNNCSDLKCDLFQNHLTDDTRCACGNTEENALHFFLECENYANSRIVMFRQTRKYHPLSLNTILYGKSSLSDNDNSFLFQAVQKFIQDTGRFE